MSVPSTTEAIPSDTTNRGQISHAPWETKGTGWIRWLPGLNTLRRYERSWLKHDLIAGLVMAAILVRVGIAYAQASGIPGINGLYATIVPLLAYAVFGPSPNFDPGARLSSGRCDPERSRPAPQVTLNVSSGLAE